MRSYCSNCGYKFSYKEKLKHYLFPFKHLECKCGKLYKISHKSLTIASLATYLPLFCYIYSLNNIDDYLYSFFIVYIIWIAFVWLVTPFFISVNEVKNISTDKYE